MTPTGSLGRGNDRGRPSPATEAFAERSYWRSMTKGFLIVSLVVAIAGLMIYRAARDSVTHAVAHNIHAIATLKANHLDHWLDEKKYDIRSVMHTELARPEFADTLRKWLHGGMRDDALRASLLNDLRQLKTAHGYLEINLRSGQDGRLLLASDGEIETASSRDLALASVRSGDTSWKDFHVGETDGVPNMHVGFLHAASIGGDPPTAVVVEVTLNASEVLFPTVLQWPGWNIPDKTLLLRREGNGVVILRNLHKVPDGAVSLGFSSGALADSTHSEAIRSGAGALLVGSDSDNQPVLAYALPVPHTPWTMVTEVRKEDVYAKLTAIAAMTTAIVVLLMLFAGWWLLQQSRGAMARVRHDAERRLLTTRIHSLAKYANDCIILCDACGRIMEVNDRCSDIYGYAEDELLQMSLADLHGAQNRSGIPQLLRQIREGHGLIHESEHERKDGTAFDVEMSTSQINLDGKPCYQVIIRDISERKKRQAEREAHMQLLNKLARRLVNVQEEERRHLSGELHDQVGANLATMNLNLHRISKMMLATPDPTRMEGILSETGRLLADTISSIRDYCADLRPATLDYSGLVPALMQLVQRFGRHSDIVTHFRQENMQERLPPQTESMLFRITQEALTNCAKHSNATTVEVALSRRDRTLVLTVSDDGRGFDPRQLGTVQVGMGLLTMSERAAMVGGALSVSSSPGMGTQIKVTLEIQEDLGETAVGLSQPVKPPADSAAMPLAATAFMKAEANGCS